MITVIIDELTPCLTDNSSGEIVETEIIRIKRKSFLSKYNKKTGWYVDWAELLKENEIYAIVVKGTVSIQGLVAVRPDVVMKTSFVTWMVAAPWNNPEKCDVKRFRRCIIMNGQTILSEPRPYRIDEIPKYNIDYRGLIKYAHSVQKTVPELSDDEKNQFIIGASIVDVKNNMLRV